MVFLSKYGREYVWIPVTAALFIAGGKYRRASIILASAFILAIILGELSKYSVAEPRPFLVLSNYHLLVPKPHDYSYPSGHALIVGVGAITLLLTLPYYISVPLTIEALLVSYSRVYVGVHWPLDVLAGWILAAAISFTALKLENFEMNVYNKLKDFLMGISNSKAAEKKRI
nr:phosphatase PAP2 family protein [Sulfuracidifex metallicus]